MANGYLCNNLSTLKKKTIVLVLLLFILVINLTSCSDKTPIILTTWNTVVFDYLSDQSIPEIRLAVYVMPSTEASRFNCLSIEKRDEGLYWSIKDADVYYTNNGVYVGYSNFVPSTGNIFKSGMYYVKYSDAASKNAETGFNINYSDDVHTKKFSELENEVFSSYSVKRIVIYSIEGDLIYFGDAITESMSDDEIRYRYPSAASYRWFYGTKNNSSAILVPPVLLLQGEEND